MKNEENKVGDILNIKSAICREFDLDEIFRYVRSAGNGGFPLSWSWGLEKPCIVIKNKALRFRVHGHHHKGLVYIVLAGSDTFTIFYTTIQDKIVKIAEDVYIDQLIEVLDIDIERIAEYKH
jgi:hypothetical protein